MAEIYRDSMNKAVTLDISGVTPTSATFKRGDVEVEGVISGATAQVPYQITRLDGDFTVDWVYTVQSIEYTKTDEHRVITPYFTKDSLIAWDSDFALLEDQKIFRLESIIRSVIQNLTGQSFGYEYSTVFFNGSGSGLVSLYKRIVKADPGLDDPSGGLLDSSVRIQNDGWTIAAQQSPTWVDAMSSTNPIRNPFKAYGRFDENKRYALTGYFGYTSVPEDIVLAALILAEDYGCDESLWRDRYIDNIRAADWRIEFHGKAFQGTGNVKVDQLLQKYTLNRMVIL